MLLYLIVDNPVDPVEVWKKLQYQFQWKMWVNKLSLWNKLYSLKLRKKDSIRDYVNSMTEVFDELSIIGDLFQSRIK